MGKRGRPRTFTDDEFKRFYENAENSQDVASNFGITTQSVHYHVQRMGLRAIQTKNMMLNSLEAIEMFNEFRWTVTIKDLAEKHGLDRTSIRNRLNSAIHMIWIEKSVSETYEPYQKLPKPPNCQHIKIYHLIVAGIADNKTAGEMVELTGVPMRKVREVLSLIKGGKSKAGRRASC